MTAVHTQSKPHAPQCIAICGLSSALYFSTLAHKRYDFREKFTEHKTCALFSLQLLSETSLILRRIQRNITGYLCQILIKLEFFLERISKNTQTSNCKKILPVGAKRFHTDRRTHTTKMFLFAIL
jgi:hypothetical protein